MNREILPDIRNKLTAPKIALDKLVKGEKVPKKFLKLALKELKAITGLLKRRKSSAEAKGQCTS